MGNQLNLDYSNALDFVREEEISQLQGAVTQAHEALHNKTGAGNDFLGWVDLPADYDKEEFSRIQQAADKISGDSDVLIVIGIGGSYLGAKQHWRAYTIRLEISFQKNSVKALKFTLPDIILVLLM